MSQGRILLRKVKPCPLLSELGNASVESANKFFCFPMLVGKFFICRLQNNDGGEKMKTQSQKVKVMSFMAMFVAIQLVLEPLTKITEMPQGGNVSFSLIALFLASYLLGPVYGVIASLVCLGVQFVLGMAVYYGIASLFLDYIIPMALVGACSIFPLWHYKQWDIPLGMIVIMILKTISHLLAGWFAFQTPLIGNLAYNIPYNVGTLIVCFILFIIIYPRIKKVVQLD